MDYSKLKVSDGTGDAATMKVQTARQPGSSVIDVDTVSKVPTSFIATHGTLNAAGFIDPATDFTFVGHVSGTDVVIDTVQPGGADNGSAEGDVVVIRPNTAWANALIDMALVSHNINGTLKQGAVNASNILSDSIITSTQLGPLSVTAPKIDFSTVKDQSKNMPFSITSFSTGYGTSAALYRQGNLVSVVMETVTTGIPSGAGRQLGETVPLGYRPAAGTYGLMSGLATDGTSSSAHVNWLFQPDGSMTLDCNTNVGNPTRFGGSAMWFTDNSWPA